MIQRYIILIGENPTHLQEQVSELIKDGWQPLGGVAATSIGKEHEGMAFYQAMVKSPQPPQIRFLTYSEITGKAEPGWHIAETK